jgi:hypothetical protein
MGLERQAWLLAHILALMGLLSVAIGWLLPEKASRAISQQIFGWLDTSLSEGVLYTSFLGMLLGLIALFVFVGSNVSVLEAVGTGKLRGTVIQEGTGIYFQLSFMLIASSVVLSSYLVEGRRAWWVVLLPVIVAMTTFWVLGGRARSITPISAGFLVFWSQRKHSIPALRSILGCFVSVVLLIIIFYAGQLYRGGAGVEAITKAFSVTDLLEYVQEAVWVDFGQLHSLAGAVVIGPSVLDGKTFVALLWPLPKIFNLQGRSAGIFITETLIGFGATEKAWGFHATLIGDTYLNFGLIGVMVVMTVFGMGLKIIYVEHKMGAVNSAFYALSVVYSIRIFFESIEKYGEVIIVLSFAFIVIKFGQIFSTISPTKEAMKIKL